MEGRRDTLAEDAAEIFRELHPRLRRFAAIVGPPEVEPDDMVQDAVERTIRRQRLADLDNPAAYLSRVILNLASDHRKHLSRAGRGNRRLGTEQVLTPSYPSDIDDLFRLPPRDRAILYLSEVEGLAHKEIAGQLGMTPDSVAKSSQRARRRLQIELREEMR